MSSNTRDNLSLTNNCTQIKSSDIPYLQYLFTYLSTETVYFTNADRNHATRQETLFLLGLRDTSDSVQAESCTNFSSCWFTALVTPDSKSFRSSLCGYLNIQEVSPLLSLVKYFLPIASSHRTTRGLFPHQVSIILQ